MIKYRDELRDTPNRSDTIQTTIGELPWCSWCGGRGFEDFNGTTCRDCGGTGWKGGHRLPPSPRAFAIEAHGDQRYGEQPYSAHLQDVVDIVSTVEGPNHELFVTVAWLHDVVEDTEVTVQDIADRYGPEVGCCVDCLTDPEGKNRRERKKALHNLLAGMHGSQEIGAGVLIVKTADRLANVRACVKAQDSRLANVRACVKAQDSRLEMYRREHAAFREAAYRPGLCDHLWAELDALMEDG